MGAAFTRNKARVIQAPTKPAPAIDIQSAEEAGTPVAFYQTQHVMLSHHNKEDIVDVTLGA
jgi:hypothetical protein